ncbi:thiol reductant ABC exporter subunit CydC [Leuconostoc pseudomesenteroides]|uniref:Thiol reductant ABC exporter subunit CydC n=1 Tax=Leuconostoc pseudomesenteroides TaxID=33968 RepID=A0A5B8SXL8_LEUPS|nr:thiol reductant ABC exporter subunit CydC [Leuconostoc pseudomesenteroides]MCC8438905.1 thiol reductant ABC exporter subunit CydC [Leuconostoc pseudomesenteroides]MDG9732760.1 thiol reductant ABC exporter subunit CydC [Leuconostoc pseudomesenteroides]NKZ35561.1 thiol reductant ABC exporter subunit CydC [Leuconostoc pseudomesenteroides]QEA41952.1 thiol reductant ABC exporter subunit CydC [Leuconostoc pseudomesenteroides]QQB27997.1 thiol reductant ABC exporter subunit CydC [Leuconostoc pseudo
MKKIQKLLQNDHWIMPFLRQQKSGLFWSIFLSFMTTFAAGALMFVSGFLISRSAQHPENILIIYVPIVLTRAFGIARPVFRYAQRLVSHNWVLRIVSKTRRRLYESVASTAGSIRGRMQTGDILSLLADDLDRLQNLYLRTLFPLGAGIMLYIFVSIGFGVVNWRFMLWWFFILAIILIVIPLLSLKWNYNGVRRQKALQNQLYTEATDAILGLQDWVLSGRQADLVSRQGKVMSELADVKNKGMKFGWWRDFIIQMLVLLLTITTLIWAGNQFANDRDLVNYIAAFTLAIFPLVDSFVGVNQGVSEASFYEDSITRLNQLPVVKKIESAPIPTNTTVKFDKVTFAYDDKTIIDHLDLTIPTGEKIALLGRSGAGKTTILKLLAGDIKPYQGEVTIGGQSVSQLQPKMSELVAVLDQQAYLFDSTILNNVRMGNIHASDEAVAAAIKQAGLQPLIDALPEGYHTQMREAGARFSGGEQQRFALARILLQAAPIVVLDEPTVSLDPKTEHDVLTQIFSVLQDRTIIWVTHHLTGIENVDKVYFLEAGKFVLSGKPSLLRDESERFKQLLLMDQY